ncbi:MAG: hypothetical protein ABS918_11185, partial [Saccharopolyspora rectivirgula]
MPDISRQHLLAPSREGGEIEAVHQPGHHLALRRSADGVEIFSLPRVDARVAQGKHGAAPEIQHQAVLLIGGRDPQRCQSGGPGPVLAQRHHLGPSGQGVTQLGCSVECETSVEQVGHHALCN